MNKPRHVPVLLEEVLEYLNVRPGGVICDATLGLAGHSSEIAKRLGGKGKLIGFDRDPEAMEAAKIRLGEVKAELGDEMPKVVFEPRAFSEASNVIVPGSLDGLLADFGVSSLQLDEAHRGFSFRSDGPLDMRQDTRTGEIAENRQSHCAGPADHDNSGTGSNRIGRGPINERRQDSSGDTNLSGTSDSSE